MISIQQICAITGLTKEEAESLPLDELIARYRQQGRIDTWRIAHDLDWARYVASLPKFGEVLG